MPHERPYQRRFDAVACGFGNHDIRVGLWEYVGVEPGGAYDATAVQLEGLSEGG